MKVVDEGTPVQDQPQIVRDTVLSVHGVEPGSLSLVEVAETPPGPDLIYAWARVKEPGAEGQFAAGYMPWGYWGYSILVKGPRAVDLIGEAAKALALGPSALPKLVAETPRVPVPRRLRREGRLWKVGAGLSALAAGAWWLRRRRAPRTPRPARSL